jgi:hypothetical protein
MNRSALCVLVVCWVSAQASAAPYLNGFETDNSGWDVYGGTNDATRVPSGTNGITSASGGFHAVAASADAVNGSAATNWGGYSSNFGGGFTTSLDIYLKFGTVNDTRFDWDSAVSNSSGGFQRDFVFNGGYYNNTSATGSGDRFVFSASNNATRSGAYPENPGRDPFAITTEGWYTFEQQFYDNGGFLADKLTIYDSLHTPLHMWTLNTTDPIATTGGNQYGYIVFNEFSSLAIDNASLTYALAAVPEPASLVAWSLLGLTIGGGAWWKRKRSA